MEPMNNFTPLAQQILALARREASRLNHNFVGTEHVLLGIIALRKGIAFVVLTRLGIDQATLRAELEKQVGTAPSDEKMIGNIPYTPRVKRVLALASKESTALRHTYVGTEHILLGLLREGDGVAARVLFHAGVEIEAARRAVLKELDPNIEFSEATDAPSQPEKPSPPRSATHQMPEPKSKHEPVPIDVSKRYDMYCNEQSGFVVYRNVRFKELRSLFRKGDFDFAYDYIEIEEANGQSFFIPRSSIIKFCEHGGTPSGESASQ